MLRRLRGFVDAVSFVILAVIAIPFSLFVPDFWEKVLDDAARIILFRRK